MKTMRSFTDEQKAITFSNKVNGDLISPNFTAWGVQDYYLVTYTERFFLVEDEEVFTLDRLVRMYSGPTNEKRYLDFNEWLKQALEENIMMEVTEFIFHI